MGKARPKSARGCWPLPGLLPGISGPLRDPERHAAELSPLLCAWFAAHGRDLPWRVSYTPYEVWISEVMLQQTQMDRAVDYFRRWMVRLPGIAALAAAPEETVLRLWEGLGYYSRARNLMAAARRIMAVHGGVFPPRLADIRALPGIGPYTAAAVASIAFGEPVACVDANVVRVLARLFNVESPVGREPAASRIREWAARLVPEGQAREHNQAMMELGALVCRKAPRCGECPLAGHCRARHLGVAAARPLKDDGPGMTALQTAAGIVEARGRILVHRRPAGGVWGGLWEFPGGELEPGEDAVAALVRILKEQAGLAVAAGAGGGNFVHTRTRFRITLFWRRLVPAAGADQLPPLPEPCWRWVTPEELADLPLPAPHRKAARLALGG